MTNAALDTFDNPAEPAYEETQNQDGIDTFDNPLPQKEEVKEETKEVDDDSQVQQLETKEEKPGEEEEEKKEDEEKPDDKKDEKPEDKKEEVETKPKGKVIKAKSGDDQVDVPAEAVVKVKVKGKNQTVTIQELMDNYSGEQAFDSKFSKINEEKKELEETASMYKGEYEEVVGHVNEIVKILDNEEANPMDALNYLLDITGRDALAFNKRVTSSQLEELELLQSMDEVEQKNYWLEKENKNLVRRQESSTQKSKSEQARVELTSKVDGLREARGISEDQFVKAYDEILGFGCEESELKPEQVIEYAYQKPFYEKAEGLTEAYKSNLEEKDFTTLVDQVKDALIEYPEAEEDIISELREKYGDDDDLAELKSKITDDTLNKDDSAVESHDNPFSDTPDDNENDFF